MANEPRSAIIRVSSAEEQGLLPQTGCAFRRPVLQLVLRIAALIVTVLRSLLAERPSGDEQRRRVATVRLALCAVSYGQVLTTKRIGLPGELRLAGAAFPCTDDGGGERRSTSVNTVAYCRRREIILPDYAAASLRPIRQGEKQMLLRSIAQSWGWLKESLAGITVRAIAAGERRIEQMIPMQLTLALLDPKLMRATPHGSLPRGVSARRLIDAPISWHEQWRALDLTRPV